VSALRWDALHSIWKDPLNEPPELELVETVIGSGGWTIVRPRRGKVDEIDDLKGEVPMQVDGSQDLPIPGGQANGHPIVDVTLGGQEANEMVA
jgi:hypothetical protein